MVKTNAKNRHTLHTCKTILLTPQRTRRKIKPSFTPSKKQVKENFAKQLPVRNEDWNTMYNKYKEWRREYFDKGGLRSEDVWYEGTYRDMIFNLGKTLNINWGDRFTGYCRPLFAFLLFVEKRLEMQVDGTLLHFENITYQKKKTEIFRKVDNVGEGYDIYLPLVNINGVVMSLLDVRFKLQYP